MSLVIGVLLPTSVMFPGVDQALLAGLEGGVGDGSPSPRFVIEPVGAGASADSVVPKLQKLLLVERPHVVVGVAGAGIVPHVRPLIDQHRTPFIACDLGADLLPNGGTPQQFIFWNSLNLWQSTHALGWWAAKELGRAAGIAASFHESGYSIVHAFFQGFLEAGGGHIAGVEVTHRESATADASDAVARLVAEKPDFLFGLYSGREGLSFMRAFVDAGLPGTIPLVTTPLMTHGHWMASMPAEVAGARTACSWVPGTYPAEEARFAAASGGRGSRPAPDVFGLLAYEAGLMIRAGLARLDGAALEGPSLRDAMVGAEFASPRGGMRIDAESLEVQTVDHLIEISTEPPSWRSRGILPLPDRYANDAQEMRATERKTGWLNAYLVN